ncbi:MAG: hypothetical protein AB1743_06055 [Actinomycetota bacterium]
MDYKKILPIVIIGACALILIIYVAVTMTNSSQEPNYANQPATYNQIPQQSNQAAPQPSAVSQLPDKPVSSSEPATLVPKDMALDKYCEKYYVAWINKDWQTAFDMQPISKKSQSDVNKFAQERESYGMQSYKVNPPEIKGHIGTVKVTMDLGQNGTWFTNWTFIKNDKGQWVVWDSKTGMGN